MRHSPERPGFAGTIDPDIEELVVEEETRYSPERLGFAGMIVPGIEEPAGEGETRCS